MTGDVQPNCLDMKKFPQNTINNKLQNTADQ
jgi:hypothetical protein